MSAHSAKQQSMVNARASQMRATMVALAMLAGACLAPAAAGATENHRFCEEWEVMIVSADDLCIMGPNQTGDVPPSRYGQGDDGSGVTGRLFGSDGVVNRRLLSAVADWTSNISGLPATQDLPDAKRYGDGRVAGLPDGMVLSDGTAGNAAQDHEPAKLAARYDDAERTIYLPAEWTGSTPAEMSVVVHEMVHHLQNVARLTYACPQHRNEAAYDAQARWLALFDSTLFDEFGIDPFVLMMSTQCIP